MVDGGGSVVGFVVGAGVVLCVVGFAVGTAFVVFGGIVVGFLVDFWGIVAILWISRTSSIDFEVILFASIL